MDYGGLIGAVLWLEPGDPELHWLHTGLSHEVTHVFQIRSSTVLRPYKTRCGIEVAERITKKTVNLYNLAPVETTCLWCVAGMEA